MSNKKHAKEVIDLSFVPVCAVVETRDAGHGCCFIGVCLYTDAAIMADTEEVINDFETLFPCGEVNGRDVYDTCVFGGGVVLEE